MSSLKTKKRKHKKNKYKLVIFDLLMSIVITFLILLSIGSCFFSIKKVSGLSMAPSFYDNQKVLLSKKDIVIKRFDVVCFKNGKETEILRVIGLPNEKIEYKDDFLLVNDQLVDEKFIIEEINEYGLYGKNFTQSVNEQNSFEFTKIPDNCYLVLGDNRPEAVDSRHYGLISKEDIVGKIIY